ncbi:MAG: hypothetical protein KDD62_13845 [Bdellovibrionales bacterium]|nr:hypothetical protein [Bdellovibrionales bacterium]
MRIFGSTMRSVDPPSKTPSLEATHIASSVTGSTSKWPQPIEDELDLSHQHLVTPVAKVDMSGLDQDTTRERRAPTRSQHNTRGTLLDETV